MIERYEADIRVRVAFAVVALSIVGLLTVVTGNLAWGGITGGAISIVLGLLRVKHNPSLWRGR